MAMEPISNITSVRAQTYTPVKPVEASAEQQPENSASAVQTAESVDKSAGAAESAKPKSEVQNGDQQRAVQNETEQIKKALEKMKKNMPNSEAIFGFHEGTHRVTIKLVDKKTKEVIRELPPEKTLDMIAKVWEMAGILVDEKR